MPTEEQREKRRISHNKWLENNREKKNAKAREWYYKNRERKLVYSHEWTKNNPEKNRKNAINSYYRHRDKVIVKSKQRYRDLVSRGLCPSCSSPASATSIYCVSHTRKEWHRHIKRSFNLLPEEFFCLVEKQENRCAICLTIPAKFDIDHDHKTGKVRGLLCHTCNFGLGGFKDNPELLRKAAQYLER